MAGAGIRAVRAVVCAAVVTVALGRAQAAEIADGVTLAGDLVVRNESIVRNGDWGADDVHHGRMRLRLGLGFEIDDAWSANVRLTTGRSNTSTFQDLDALNDQFELWVDRAFISYRLDGAVQLNVTGGRTPNPYITSGIIWDPDFSSDGLCEKLRVPFEGGVFFLNLGQHVLDEFADSDYGVTFFGVQPGVELELGRVKVTAAAAVYSFHHVEGTGDVPAGEDYALADINVKLKTKVAGGVPFAGWLHAMQNTEADDAESGFGIGASVGSDKGLGKMKFSLEYRSVDANAIWINLGDSTFGSGLYGEDMSGCITGVSVGLGDGTKFSVKWFSKDSDLDDAHEDRILVDFAVKF